MLRARTVRRVAVNRPHPGAVETTQTIQIPVYESLTDEHLERVASVVRDVVLTIGTGLPAALHQS